MHKKWAEESFENVNLIVLPGVNFMCNSIYVRTATFSYYLYVKYGVTASLKKTHVDVVSRFNHLLCCMIWFVEKCGHRNVIKLRLFRILQKCHKIRIQGFCQQIHRALETFTFPSPLWLLYSLRFRNHMGTKAMIWYTSKMCASNMINVWLNIHLMCVSV